MTNTTTGIIGAFPKHLLDYTLGPFLKIFWRPFARKDSKFWHWQPYSFNPINTCKVERDPELYPGESMIFWDKTVILERKHNPEKAYRIGFVNVSGNKKEICSLLIRGPVALLIGPETSYFFAEDFDTRNIIPIQIKDFCKKTELSKQIPLL